MHFSKIVFRIWLPNWRKKNNIKLKGFQGRYNIENKNKNLKLYYFHILKKKYEYIFHDRFSFSTLDI